MVLTTQIQKSGQKVAKKKSKMPPETKSLGNKCAFFTKKRGMLSIIVMTEATLFLWQTTILAFFSSLISWIFSKTFCNLPCIQSLQIITFTKGKGRFYGSRTEYRGHSETAIYLCIVKKKWHRRQKQLKIRKSMINLLLRFDINWE